MAGAQQREGPRKWLARSSGEGPRKWRAAAEHRAGFCGSQGFEACCVEGGMLANVGTPTKEHAASAGKQAGTSQVLD